MADEFDAEFSLWAFLRDALIQGRHIAQALDGESYERYSARLDSAARELEGRIRAHLADRRAVAGLREALVKIGRYDGPDFARHALLTANAALAAAGEGGRDGRIA